MTNEYEPDPDSKNLDIARYWMTACLKAESELVKTKELLEPMTSIYKKFLTLGVTHDTFVSGGKTPTEQVFLNLCASVYELFNKEET